LREAGDGAAGGDPAYLLVDLGQVEEGRVEVAQPVEPFLRPLVVGLAAGQRGHDVLVARDAAHVLRRARALASETTGRRSIGVERVHGLDLDRVRPAVAEVVLVEQPVAALGDHLVEAYVALGDALLTLGLTLGLGLVGEEGLGAVVVGARAHRELVQVGVGPPHPDLQHLVEAVERQVAREHEPTPDRRFRAVEVDADGEPSRDLRLLQQRGPAHADVIEVTTKVRDPGGSAGPGLSRLVEQLAQERLAIGAGQWKDVARDQRIVVWHGTTVRDDPQRAPGDAQPCGEPPRSLVTVPCPTSLADV